MKVYEFFLVICIVTYMQKYYFFAYLQYENCVDLDISTIMATVLVMCLISVLCAK